MGKILHIPTGQYCRYCIRGTCADIMIDSYRYDWVCNINITKEYYDKLFNLNTIFIIGLSGEDSYTTYSKTGIFQKDHAHNSSISLREFEFVEI